MRTLAILVVAGALAASACGSGTNSSAGRTPAGAATKAAASPAAAKSPAVAQTQTGGQKTYTAPPPMTIDVNKKYFATIKMDIGDIRLELFAKDAPVTVNNFVFLARDHFYDGVTFHRVIPGFVAQAGDPQGTGRGGPGYTIKDEVNSHKFLDGTLGMAIVKPHTNSGGSQWFIDYAPQPALDGDYTVFGQLVSGREVLDKIAPRNPVPGAPPGTKINTIVIEEQ